MPSNHKPVEIVWLDSGITSAGDDTWQHIDKMVENLKLATVRSVGYLVAETDDTYYLCQTYDPTDNAGINLMAIAKSNVEEFNVLRRR